MILDFAFQPSMSLPFELRQLPKSTCAGTKSSIRMQAMQTSSQHFLKMDGQSDAKTGQHSGHWLAAACVASLAIRRGYVKQSAAKSRWKSRQCSVMKRRHAPDAIAHADNAPSLSFTEVLLILRPYFWPSTGTWNDVAMNRIRAISTWVCVICSKATMILAPIVLARATEGIGTLLRSARPDAQPIESMMYLAAYAALVFISKLFKELQAILYIKVKQAAYIEIADHTFKHLHSLSLAWHFEKKQGATVRLMDRGIKAAHLMMQYVFLYLIPAICETFVVATIFALHFKNKALALFVLMHMASYMVFTVVITNWRRKYRKAAVKSDDIAASILTDALTNYETIKYFNAEEHERSRYRHAVAEMQKADWKTQISLSMLTLSQEFVIGVATFGGLVLAAQRVLRAGGSVGDLVAVNAYIIQMFIPFGFLGSIYNMSIDTMVDMRGFTDLLAERPQVYDPIQQEPLNLIEMPGVPMIEFRNVSFAYNKQATERQLRGLSFKIPHGSTVAVVGPTGAGKTTITRLLFRLFDPSSGQVLVNGQDVRTVSQESLRLAIGMVPQDICMFNMSIEGNIRYGRLQGASMSDIVSAATKAQLSEFIEQQEQGYETVVGERGLKLSGGEKQRLAIARCLLKDPSIVVLDEATSALDTQTERRVQHALAMLSASRTVLAIAHRLSTIKSFDLILVLDEGRIAEQGTHDELLAQSNSRYAAMWAEQERAISEGTAKPSATSFNEGDSLPVADVGITVVAHGQ